jgi:hypothetical protein
LVIFQGRICPQTASNIHVICAAKDGNDRRIFDAEEWLAAMCSHVPNRGEQMVRYYGCYSNVSRGKRQEENPEDIIPYLIESDIPPKARRKTWARLIQKIYEADPLICPKCQGTMRIISSIEDQEVIKAILQYLGMRTIRPRPHAKAHAPPSCRYVAADYCRSLPDNAA